MKQILFFVSVLIVLSCNDRSNTNLGGAFIGGEIINPNNDYVVLYDANIVIDTLYLDQQNRFSHTFKNLKPGLHSFVHGGEIQVVLLEPQDSVMIRLNTLDFDESLVFSGHGAKKNNYLVNLSNTLEAEFRKSFEYSRLDPKTFQAKLDSIKDIKFTKFQSFNDKHPNSKLFKTIASSYIDYNYYTSKELYSSRHFGNNVSTDHSLFPDNFYDFRKKVDYSNKALEDFYHYNNFLFLHFNNLARDRYFETISKTQKHITQFNRQAVDFNLIKLELMDSLVTNKAMKNNLIKIVTRNFLSNSSSTKDSETIYNSFLAKSSDEEGIKYINLFYDTLKRLKPGKKFPDLLIISALDKDNSINQVILNNKPTVIYFWSNAIKSHFINSHKKANKLREEYPDVNFIAVNINGNSDYIWKRMLNLHKYDLDYEYKFKNPEFARRILALTNISKVMVVDKDLTIISSNINMFSKDLVNVLDKL